MIASFVLGKQVPEEDFQVSSQRRVLSTGTHAFPSSPRATALGEKAWRSIRLTRWSVNTGARAFNQTQLGQKD